MSAGGRPLVICATVLAAACASAPIHYHTLIPLAANADIAPPIIHRNVDVESVHIPAQVDRFELVVRERSGEMALLDNELWVASLSDEIKTALSLELERQLGAPTLDSRGWPTAISVRLDVERFESAPARYAFIAAAWRVRAMEGTRAITLTCNTHAYEDVSRGYDELVRGHQRAVISIADQIAAAIRELATQSAAECPAA